jgi:hypothetical protein
MESSLDSAVDEDMEQVYKKQKISTKKERRESRFAQKEEKKNKLAQEVKKKNEEDRQRNVKMF